MPSSMSTSQREFQGSATSTGVDINTIVSELLQDDVSCDDIDDIIERLDRSDSFIREGLCYSSNIPSCSPEDALAEKLYNSMDSHRYRYAGSCDSLFDASDQILNSNVDINLQLTGRHNARKTEAYVNTTVADAGDGKSNTEFEDEFFMPNEMGVSKKRDDGTQGKNGKGSLSALNFSYRGFQFILSSKSANNTFSVGIVCESPEDSEYSHDYFLLADGSIPQTDLKSVSVSEKIGVLDRGTVIRNYDYNLGVSDFGDGYPRSLKENIAASIRRLLYSVPNPPMPINVYDTRGTTRADFTYEGLESVLELDKYSEMTFKRDTIPVNGETVSGELEFLKVIPNDKENNPLFSNMPRKPHITATYNGQTHSWERRSYLPNTLTLLKQAGVFISVECSGLNVSQSKLFNSDRNGWEITAEANEIEEKIIEYLEADDQLLTIQETWQREKNLETSNSPNFVRMTTDDLDLSADCIEKLRFDIDTNKQYFEEFCSISIPNEKFEILDSSFEDGLLSITLKPLSYGIQYLHIEVEDDNFDSAVTDTIEKVEVTHTSQKERKKVPRTSPDSTQNKTENSDKPTFLYHKADSSIAQLILKYVERSTDGLSSMSGANSINRATSQGKGLENTCEFLLSGPDGKLAVYKSSDNHFPDYPMKKGPFYEVKKINSVSPSKIPTNSSLPHSRVDENTKTIDSNLQRKLSNSDKSSREVVYLIGHMSDSNLSHIWATFGDVLFSQDREWVQDIKQVHDGTVEKLRELGYDAGGSNEIYNLTVDDGKASVTVRGRNMYHFSHPQENLSKDIDIESYDNPLFLLIREERFNELSEVDKSLIDKAESISVMDVDMEYDSDVSVRLLVCEK